MPTYRYQVG